MRTLILLACSASLFAASLPAWACGMPPRDEARLAEVMADLDSLLVPAEAPETPAAPGLEAPEPPATPAPPPAPAAPAEPQT